MAFRRGTNSHDAWLANRDRHAPTLAGAGLPPAAYAIERAFVTFLTDGNLPGTGASLDALSEAQFGMLFRLVSSWYDWDAVDFTALERRRLRRGTGS